MTNDAPRGTRALRVLVVEDNAAIRGLIGAVLAAEGFGPIEAETAGDAFRVLSADPPDAVLVDAHLPDMDGEDVIRCIRAAEDLRLRSLPLIGLSRTLDEGARMIGVGAACVVEKPVRADALVRAVNWALDVYADE